MISDEYSSTYAQYIVAIFRQKLEEGYDTDAEEIPFTAADINAAQRKHDLSNLENKGDLPYNLRGRSNLPDELAQHGYDSVIQNINAKSSSAAYLITKRTQIIDVPQPSESTSIDLSGVPDLVNEFTSHDEQGVLTLIRYADVVSKFTSLDRCHHLQNHLRASFESGQVEIDSLYVGSRDEEPVIVIVEGKGMDEEFTRNQLRMNAAAIESLDAYPDTVHIVGVQPRHEDLFTIVEFEIPPRYEGQINVQRTKEYTFGQQGLSNYIG